MSFARLKARIPNASRIGAVSLPGRVLRFRKVSTDGSAKCDIPQADCDSDLVWGVLFAISNNEKKTLDEFEGLGQGYEESVVEVVDDFGISIEAVTYVATSTDDNLLPYTWYKKHVLIGARESELPATYIQRIEAVRSKSDPNKSRSQNELSIYI